MCWENEKLLNRHGYFSGNLEKMSLMSNEREVSYAAKCKYMRIQRTWYTWQTILNSVSISSCEYAFILFIHSILFYFIIKIYLLCFLWGRGLDFRSTKCSNEWKKKLLEWHKRLSPSGYPLTSPNSLISLYPQTLEHQLSAPLCTWFLSLLMLVFPSWRPSHLPSFR